MTKDDIIIYFKASLEELKKVRWPSREATVSQTVQVIVLSLAVALFLGATDLLFNYILGFLLNI